MRSWLAVSAMVSLVIMGGIAVVMSISLVVNGGGLAGVVRMLETAAKIVGVVAGIAVLGLVAHFITTSVGNAFDRWRCRSPEDEQDQRGTGITGRPGLFVMVAGTLLVAGFAALGRFELKDIADVFLAAVGLTVLAAVCWCCDKVAAKRRRWRELGSEGRWWDQR